MDEIAVVKNTIVMSFSISARSFGLVWGNQYLAKKAPTSEGGGPIPFTRELAFVGIYHLILGLSSLFFAGAGLLDDTKADFLHVAGLMGLAAFIFFVLPTYVGVSCIAFIIAFNLLGETLRFIAAKIMFPTLDKTSARATQLMTRASQKTKRKPKQKRKNEWLS